MKEWKAPEKEAQKMTRDGAVSVNLVTGETTYPSNRTPEQDHSASGDTAGAAGKVVDRAELHREQAAAKKKRRKQRRAYREGEAAASRPSSRLQFSEADRAVPELQGAIRKSDKAADRLDAAKAAVPSKPPSPQHTNPLSRPIQEAGAAIHGKVREVEQENSDGVEKGMVISQKEKPDTVIPRFSKVTVVISAGSDKVDLAELGLSGMTLEPAVRLLEGKSLKADVQEESSEDVPSGTIVRYEPEVYVALGSTVTPYVSTGPEEEFVSVPNLYGKTDAEASVLLSAAGLVAGEISKEYDSTISAGHVISQGVEAGTQVAPGETVDYTVSLGPEAPKKQFIASLDASYPLQVSYGPGAASSEIQILIRIKQTVNGKVTYTKLAEPKSYSADTTLNIKHDKIRGADGVQTGEVEIEDLPNKVVLTSYNVTFTEVDS